MTNRNDMQENNWQLMLCPFHDDHNASLAYNDKGFICLACGRTGTADDLRVSIHAPNGDEK